MTDEERDRLRLMAMAYARVRAAEHLLRDALGDLHAADEKHLAAVVRQAVSRVCAITSELANA